MFKNILIATVMLVAFAVSNVAYASTDKMTLCHATGSTTNPYVMIAVALPAVSAHLEGHHDFVFPQFPGATNCSSTDDGDPNPN